ncbi:MAG: AAA family ATPase, partial [Eubacterium sp.]
MNIITGKVKSAQKVVLYGPEGIGKTTFASHFPDPLFIDTEGGTKQLDVKRTQAPGDF